MAINYAGKFTGGELVPNMDSSKASPYGDTYNDGAIQVSFTLPVPHGDKATKAAELLLEKIGFHNCQIVHDQDLGEGFTFFTAYVHTSQSVNYNEIKVKKVESNFYTRDDCDRLIKERFGRHLTIVGACTGDDAHTVGIDAILNMKGVDHHYGLERYEMFDVYNLGSQVKNEDLIRFAREHKADAILVSQIVTQKDTHLHNLTEFIELAEAEGIRERILLIVGGPRISHELALELGFDAGFGRKTYPEHVASFITDKLWERNRKKTK